MAKSFPKVIHVRVENEDTKDEMLLAEKKLNPSDFIETPERVGVYKLEKIIHVSTKIEIHLPKKRQRRV